MKIRAMDFILLKDKVRTIGMLEIRFDSSQDKKAFIQKMPFKTLSFDDLEASITETVDLTPLDHQSIDTIIYQLPLIHNNDGQDISQRVKTAIIANISEKFPDAWDYRKEFKSTQINTSSVDKDLRDFRTAVKTLDRPWRNPILQAFLGNCASAVALYLGASLGFASKLGLLVFGSLWLTTKARTELYQFFYDQSQKNPPKRNPIQKQSYQNGYYSADSWPCYILSYFQVVNVDLKSFGTGFRQGELDELDGTKRPSKRKKAC